MVLTRGAAGTGEFTLLTPGTWVTAGLDLAAGGASPLPFLDLPLAFP